MDPRCAQLIHACGLWGGCLCACCHPACQLPHVLFVQGTALPGYCFKHTNTIITTASLSSPLYGTALLPTTRHMYVNKRVHTHTPQASTIIVYAKTAPDKGAHGITAFIVEKGMKVRVAHQCINRQLLPLKQSNY